MTGLTAEKHDAFLSFDENMSPLESFSGEQLIQSEPDASSFPSGGLRATWEARGYTAWNPSSPVFIFESAGTRTLCVPSVFIGYHGEALDEMTPMLRASEALSKRAIELLALIGDKDVLRVVTTLGPEQEFFIIDREHFALRPDLVMSGRTLLGSPPPRGQQLEDHYFVGIPERVMACFAEVERELYKLGVPIVTRHTEVAPCQFEMAPRFEETDLGVDHNQLVMTILKRVSLRHGLQALVHEKPFAGINGSGKHCNWSMSLLADSDLDGVNLLKPGKTPHQNLRFLIFLAAVLKAVHKHAGLLRAGIASSGNEHRLGANEAPPAIISVFMGEELTRVINDIAAGRTGSESAQQAMIKLGVDKLPEVARDNTDRNRTSPFAFTGAKFEFRAVGGSASIAFPVMILTATVAEAVGELIVALKSELKKTKNVDNAVLKVVRAAFQETAKVRFEGNNYSDAWVKEAKKRGLAESSAHARGAGANDDQNITSVVYRARRAVQRGTRRAIQRAHGALRQGHADRAEHAGANGAHTGAPGGVWLSAHSGRRGIAGEARGNHRYTAGRDRQRSRQARRRFAKAIDHVAQGDCEGGVNARRPGRRRRVAYRRRCRRHGGCP